MSTAAAASTWGAPLTAAAGRTSREAASRAAASCFMGVSSNCTRMVFDVQDVEGQALLCWKFQGFHSAHFPQKCPGTRFFSKSPFHNRFIVLIYESNIPILIAIGGYIPMKKKLLSLTLALAMVLALAACSNTTSSGGAAASPSAPASAAPSEDAQAPSSEPTGDEGSSAAESDLAYVQGKGTLVVGITVFEPMDYEDANGEWIGFDADLAKLFGEELGVNVEFQIIDWDNKVLELDGKNIDVVWNGMTLTDEVLAAMECSQPYLNNQQVVVVPSDVAGQYQDEASIQGLSFAVEAGSSGEAVATELGLTFTSVVDQATAVLETSAGTSDAAIIDSLMAAAMVGEGTSYANLTYTVPLSTEEYGVGFRKGSDLAAKLNEFFAAKYADGTMQKLAETYGVQAALITQ